MWQHIINWLTHIYSDHGWVMQVFIVVFLTLLFHMFVRLVMKRIVKKTEKTRNYLDESLFKALQGPLGCIIWLLGICFAADIAGSVDGSSMLFEYVPHVRSLGSVFLVTWFLIRFVRRVEINYILHSEANGKTVDKTLVHALSQLLTISVIITGILVGMQLFGVPISGLLAFGGIGGAGIAFASKDLLANFFGGIIIYLDRPFKVGDWIRSPDRNIEGTVEYIGWRLTRIRTFDKRPLYVPNGTFLTISVENPSRMTNRRIRTLIGVRYNDASKIATLTQSIEAMLREHPEIDTRQTLMVNLTEFAASSLNILVYTFTKTTNWVAFQSIQQDVFLKIIEIIEQHGAECAFPTSTLHIPDVVRMESSN